LRGGGTRLLEVWESTIFLINVCKETDGLFFTGVPLDIEEALSVQGIARKGVGVGRKKGKQKNTHGMSFVLVDQSCGGIGFFSGLNKIINRGKGKVCC